MITNLAMYHKAQRVHAQMGDTPAERERARVIGDHLLIWEWAHDSALAVEVIPPPPPHPRAASFLAWWERNRESPTWASGYRAALLWWLEPLALSPWELMVVSEDVDLELLERYEEANAGMVVTSLEQVPEEAA